MQKTGVEAEFEPILCWYWKFIFSEAHYIDPYHFGNIGVIFIKEMANEKHYCGVDGDMNSKPSWMPMNVMVVVVL